MALPRLRRAVLIAGVAVGLGALGGARPALAWWHASGGGGWHGGGVFVGVSPPPIIVPPPVYYPPPAYYAPPPVVYAPSPPVVYAPPPPPPPVTGACYAGAYSCPLDHAMPLGAPCYCLSNQRTQIWGHVR